MQNYTLPDITPAGKVNLGKAASDAGMPTSAIWINMTASGTTIRYGDGNVGSARGCVLSTGVPFLTHPRGDNTQTPYDLNKISVFGGNSDTVSITYGF